MIEKNKKKILTKEISHLSRDIDLYLSKKLEKYKIGSGQFKILINIKKNEGICQDKLAEKLGIDKTTITKAIKKLIEKKYVKREKNKIDKRYYKLYIGEEGEKIYPEIKNIFNEINIKLMLNFSEKEKEIFFDFIKKINKNLERIKENEKY
ncbi:MarR family transcriptional regulator [Hypnocyclicus thermotrophus]|uniref:MarR family transcriptional regulator n=1 Tax=Hypnocyclicus thermotrophus TaxID=1627895 RepID=A0AA46E036_9FUSO|nr:MarR family transcriptional regulator [Hypnocyclicus thermotrophus]TDT72322.1 MarR family transcriptional regulator [Hypnocyclicus thermotrophus]